MKSHEFLQEATELDQLLAQTPQPTQPGLIKTGLTTLGRDLTQAPSALSKAIAKGAGITKGSSQAVITPGPGQTTNALANPEVQPSTQPQIDPKIKQYVQKMAGNNVAYRSTGTPEVDAMLKSFGLMK
jgi:hypothetical protein